MPSAWHRDDDREYSDAPLDMPCRCGCGRTVRIAAEDWREDGDYFATACVLRNAASRHAAEQWPEDIPA